MDTKPGIEYETWDNIPEWALPYLYSDNAEGLSDEDMAMIDEFRDAHGLGYAESWDDEVTFSHYPAFGLACNVRTVTFSKPPKE